MQNRTVANLGDMTVIYGLTRACANLRTGCVGRAPTALLQHWATFDLPMTEPETPRSMTQGCSFISSARAASVLGLSALLAVSTGCRKQADAGGPPAMPPTTVIAAEAKRQPVAETLAVVGTLIANESLEVKAETDGTIVEIAFEEGQPVNKGDLLIRLEDTKFTAALAEAEANLKLATATYERNQGLLRDKLIAQQEFDQAASVFQAGRANVDLRRRQLADTRIVAPFSGIVGSRNVSPGQVIAKNTTLTWLVDMDTLKAEFNVPERFLSELKPGQRITLTVAAFPEEKFQGEVYFLGPQIDPTTRTVLMKARVPNQGRKLRPGMFANLELTLTLRSDAVVIPESALMSVGERTSVYIISNDTAVVRPVKVGVRMPNRIEVTAGLQGGEMVIAEGVQKTRPGGPVKIAATPPAGGTNAPRRL
jgi:membrane fusion protein, multidrug efflux system